MNTIATSPLGQYQDHTTTLEEEHDGSLGSEVCGVGQRVLKVKESNIQNYVGV